ncbi:hypothetical protein QJS10_CPA05g00375 [Acorus calamus]|uniref:HMA domain-containing protein n=1 Tax=Acorus calamus TaxID=4465 RepID=A0AAV9EWJ1_ACOCL|nr:hypothetical protein QJS10_CPA05g00375 [Acorus calamus]
MKGIPAYIIGIVRGVSTVVGISAMLLYPVCALLHFNSANHFKSSEVVEPMVGMHCKECAKKIKKAIKKIDDE